MTQVYVIDRPNDTALRVRGQLLAHVSSHHAGKPRWTELAVYLTTTGKYVVHVVGASLVPGEEQRVTVRQHSSADQVIASLERVRGEVRELSGLAKALLLEASQVDQDLRQELYRRADTVDDLD